MSKWIKISETLPPEEISVLVTDGDFVGLAQLRVIRNPDGRSFKTWDIPGVWGYEWELDEPTHWQPISLPNPPANENS